MLAGTTIGVLLAVLYALSQRPWSPDETGFAYLPGNLDLPCAASPRIVRDPGRPPTSDDKQVLVALQGEPFRAWKLDGPKGAERDDDGPAYALRASIKLGQQESGGIEPVPARGWTRLYTTSREAEFVARDAYGLVSVQVERTSDGWEFAGSSYGPVPRAVRPDGRGGFGWCLDRDAPGLTPSSTSISLVAQGIACRSETDNELEPEARYASDAVIITAFHRRLRGACTGPPRDVILRGTVQLREPLGDRGLIDGQSYPPGAQRTR